MIKIGTAWVAPEHVVLVLANGAGSRIFLTSGGHFDVLDLDPTAVADRLANA